MSSSPEYMREWRKKNAEHKKAYAKKWYAENSERAKRTNKKWGEKNPEKRKEYNKKGTIKRRTIIPWSGAYRNAQQRCNNPNNNRFKSYGARGIRFNMTMQDFKYLWFRDSAEMMKKPSIHRVNNDGDYILGNCKFIELVKNIKHAA